MERMLRDEAQRYQFIMTFDRAETKASVISLSGALAVPLRRETRWSHRLLSWRRRHLLRPPMARDLHASTRGRKSAWCGDPGQGPRRSSYLSPISPTYQLPAPFAGAGIFRRVAPSPVANGWPSKLGQLGSGQHFVGGPLRGSQDRPRKPLQRTRCRRPRGRRLPVAAGFSADTTTPGCANGFKGLVDFEPKSSASYTRVASAPAILHCNFLRCIALYRRSAVPDALPEYSHGPSRNSGSPCCCHLHLRIWLRVRSARVEVGGPEVHRAHSQIF